MLVQHFLRRRALEGAGCLILLLVGCYTAALLTYHPSDPSLNHAHGGRAVNALGMGGANLADLVLQLIGLAWILAVPVGISWGIAFLRKSPVSHPGWRTTAFIAALVCGAGFAGIFSPSATWPVRTGLGGLIGMWLSQMLLPVFKTPGVALLTFAPMVAGLFLALAIPFATWRTMMGAFFDTSGWLGRRIFNAGRHVSGTLKDTERKMRESSVMPRRGKHQVTGEGDLLAARAMKGTVIQAADRKDGSDGVKTAQAVVQRPKHTEAVQTSLEFGREGGFDLPSLKLLSAPSSKSRKRKVSDAALAQNARMLEGVLQDFGVQGEITQVNPGPVVTLYELVPAPGTKSSRVIGLADDIARSMSAVSARIAVIPGKNALGIELPNQQRETVYLRELLEHASYQGGKHKLPLTLGKDIGGEPSVADLAKMPHLLVAGTTGSGKSVAINAMIMSLIYRLTPEECKFIMIDPKMLELSIYDGIPHLLAPVVTEPAKAVVALKWVVREMENRYRLMSTLNVRNVDGYNKRLTKAIEKGEQINRSVQTGYNPETGEPVFEQQPIDMTPLPYIVVIVDEMADLMLVAGKDIEASIQRLAQMARAAGIHIIMATQRPSVDVITGVIKANFPTRISFQVTSRVDSRTILGEQGAEQLLGMGDMLFMSGGARITRVHGPFVEDGEVEQIVKHLRAQGEPEYVESITADDGAPDGGEGGGGFGENGGGSGDELFDRAVAVVIQDGKASTSYLQRRLKVGYNRAASLIEKMEQEGIVSQANHVGKREVLAGKEAA